MIFADTDAQYVWTHFGLTGLAFLFTLWLTAILAQIWVSIRTNAHLDSLKRATERDSIRFSKLHEERAAVIKALYDKLLALSEAGMVYVTDGTDANKMKFVKGMMEFGAFYKTNKIYFSESVCEKMQDVTYLMFSAVGEKFAYPHREKEMSDSEKINRDYNVLMAVSPEILAELEYEFRQLLGVEVEKKRKVKSSPFIDPRKMKEIADKVNPKAP